MTAIRLEGLTKRFGRTVAVEGLDLEVASGELLVLVGPSGCGKSTVLDMIAGLEAPTSGRVLFDGRPVEHRSPRERDVAVVFQSYALYPHMTVFDNVAFPLRVAGVPRGELRRRVHETAEKLSIGELLERRPRALSGGQRQRVALARAMVRRPAVFLFDEPLSNLDAQLRHTTRAEIAELHAELGATFVYVTHDQVEALSLGQRLAVLDAGRLRQLGTPRAVYGRPADTFVARFLGSPPMNLLAAELAGGGLRLGGAHLALPRRLAASLAGRSGPVLLGVRAEDVHLAPAGAPVRPGAGTEGGPALELAVRLVESLGADSLVHLTAPGIDLVARTGREAPAAGQRLRATLAPDHLHLFEPATGVSIGP